MLDSSLLDILCCPETGKNLVMASEACLASVNEQISAGKLKNVAGEFVTEPLIEALVTVDKSRLYPIREGIPVLLVDESIVFSLEEK